MNTNNEHASCEVCGKTFDDNSTVVEMVHGEFAHEDCCEFCYNCGESFHPFGIVNGLCECCSEFGY